MKKSLLDFSEKIDGFRIGLFETIAEVVESLNVPFFEGLEAKFRFGIVNADHRTNATAVAASGEDPSYHEFRFELNYLF